MDHAKHLRELEAEARESKDYTKLLQSYPLLYGYWQQQLKGQDAGHWLAALEKCPTQELWLAFLKEYPTSEHYKLAVEAVGYNFHAAAIWDKLIEYDESYLEQVLTVPLYDYAKYFVKAKQSPRITDLAEKSSAMTANIQSRWPFESKIKRSYFHVLPLDQAELDLWNNYLDFQEMSNDDPRVTAALYRRCLNVTALYPKFWIRYLRWAATASPDLLDKIWNEACIYTVGPNRVKLGVLYAANIEVLGDLQKSELILGQLGDAAALGDFKQRNNLDDPQLSLEEAKELWAQRQIDKVTYRKVLLKERDLEELFKFDTSNVKK